MTEISKKFAKRLKGLRQQKKITIEKLAYENDMSKGNLSKIERGMVDPQLSTLKRIAEGLDISLKELFDF